MSAAGLSRDEALELLHEHLKQERLVKHSLAAEAIMRALAPRFGGDPEAWGIAGLLHDVDLDIVGDDYEAHAETGARIAAERGLSGEYVEAIRRHKVGPEEGLRTTTLDHALAAAESITGLIVATALVYPDKKLTSVKAKSVRKRFKQARFAAGASRDHIRECEEIGIGLPEFVEVSLEAMRGIAPQLGL